MATLRFLQLRRTPAASWFIPLLALAALSGCGKRSPYSCVPVSGKVTYDDGSLILADQIHVVFISQTPPADPKMPPKNGVATADGKTGTFDYATTYAFKDGIVAGEHKVVIQCLRKGHLLRNLIPVEFGDPVKTPLRARSSDLPIKLTVPKSRQQTANR